METATEMVAREKELNSTSTVTMVVVLTVVTVTFAAMIAVFFIRAQKNYLWGHIQIPSLLWITTALLLASSLTLEGARRRLKVNDQRAFFRLAACTTGLAALFLIGQVTAWFQVLHSGVVLANNPHSWFIFLFSGLHGMHIVAGLGGLGYLLWRTREPASGPKYQMVTRVVTNGVSVFWHYLGFVWVVLFALLVGWRR